MMAVWKRMEDDDEIAFKALAPDFDEFKPQIDELKKNMHPQQRIARGIHARLYEYLKMQKYPDLRAQLYGTAAPPPAVPETPPAAPPAAPPAPAPVAPTTPRPSPVAAPTPGSRGTPPAPAVPKIKASEKLTRMAAAARMSVDDYIKELEARGMSQEDVDRASAPLLRSPSAGGSSAYGRSRAAR
jgi:hypothetical protein